MPQWCRIESFYERCPDNTQSAVFSAASNVLQICRQVEFRCIAKTTTIKRVIILHYHEEGFTEIRLEGTGYDQDLLTAAISENYLKHEYRQPIKSRQPSTFYLSFNSEALLQKIINLLNLWNKKYEYTTFPEEIFTEIRQIFNFLYKHKCIETCNHQHVIREFQSRNSHTNPARENTAEIYKQLVYFNDSPTFRKQLIKKSLANGENLNLRTYSNATPLHYAIWYIDDLEIIDLFLNYGANAFERDNGLSFSSPIEIALFRKEYKKLDLIIASCTKPEKPITTRIIACDLQYENHQIITKFTLSNGKIFTTHLKSNQDLTQEELDWILNTSAKFFYKANDPTKEKLKREILDDIFSDNRIIEIIRHDLIIGFNLFEIILIKNNQNRIYLHNDRSLLLPEYRHTNIMTPLDFRLAYALQKLNQAFIVGVFYLCINGKSYRKASGLHSPKYQPDNMDEEIKELLDIIYGHHDHYVHEDIACYVTGESIVEGVTLSIQKEEFNQRFFYKFILNLNDETTTKGKAAPILFKIAEDEFREYAEQWRKLGLNLPNHIDRLAFLLPPFLANILFPKIHSSPSNQNNTLNKSRFLFWQNKQIPAYDIAADMSTLEPRAKL